MKRDVSAETLREMSVAADSTLRDALQAIDRGALGICLVVDGPAGSLVGLLTDGDIRRALLAGGGLSSPVSGIAHGTLVVAKAGTPPEELAALFSDSIRVIPLLDDARRVLDLAIMDRRAHLPMARPTFKEAELQYVTECILTGWVSSAGKFVTRFEEQFASFCGSRFAVSTSSGTTALHLALLACDVGPGDEVVMPTLSFIATANAAVYAGAKPVFVDSDPVTGNLDPDRVEAALTSRTRAIVPVHLYGHPADMDPILRIARERNVAVVEDAAEAHGARYKGRRVGPLGRAGVFSFYGNKIVTTGEGGMIVTNDEKLAARVRMLRDHGMSPQRRYWHPVVGYNYRMTNLQAAVGVGQMERIDEILEGKQRVAKEYREGLAGIPGATMPADAPWAENAYWMVSLYVEAARFGMTRDQLMERLSGRGIETRPIFPPMHKQPIYENGLDLPVATRLADTGLNLPSSSALSSADIRRVCQEVRSAQIEAGS